MKADNIRIEESVDRVYLAEPDITRTVIWDIVDKHGNIVVPDLSTPEDEFAVESARVISSFVKDTVPAGETP